MNRTELMRRLLPWMAVAFGGLALFWMYWGDYWHALIDCMLGLLSILCAVENEKI